MPKKSLAFLFLFFSIYSIAQNKKSNHNWIRLAFKQSQLNLFDTLVLKNRNEGIPAHYSGDNIMLLVWDSLTHQIVRKDKRFDSLATVNREQPEVTFYEIEKKSHDFYGLKNFPPVVLYDCIIGDLSITESDMVGFYYDGKSESVSFKSSIIGYPSQSDSILVSPNFLDEGIQCESISNQFFVRDCKIKGPRFNRHG